MCAVPKQAAGGDNASFYGVGAAALVTDGELQVNGTTINTDADGGTYTSNGVGSPAIYSTADLSGAGEL